MKLTLNGRRRRRTGAVMTAEEYRALIQAYVDQARADQSVAERLASEARQRFGAETDVPEQPK